MNKIKVLIPFILILLLMFGCIDKSDCNSVDEIVIINLYNEHTGGLSRLEIKDRDSINYLCDRLNNLSKEEDSRMRSYNYNCGDMDIFFYPGYTYTLIRSYRYGNLIKRQANLFRSASYYRDDSLVAYIAELMQIEIENLDCGEPIIE